MITLRSTKKLQQHLGVKPESADEEPTSPLGDWYGNLVYMPNGPPLILIVNERSLLSVVLRHDADVLAEFKRRVIALLRRLEIPKEAIERESFHLQQIRIGRTRNRRVLGCMIDATYTLEAMVFEDPRNNLAERAENRLAETLYSVIKYKHPLDVARALLGAPPRSKPAPLPMRLAPETDRSPTKARGKIALNHCVPIKLSARDRELIMQCAMLDEGLTKPLEGVPPGSGELVFGYTLEEQEELLGWIASEANHCKNKKLQRELDDLFERVSTGLESDDVG